LASGLLAQRILLLSAALGVATTAAAVAAAAGAAQVMRVGVGRQSLFR